MPRRDTSTEYPQHIVVEQQENQYLLVEKKKKLYLDTL